MSEMKMAVLVSNETVMQSFYKDFVTGVMCAFLVYISQGSTWWTFITGLMFIIFIFAKIASIIGRHNTFKTKADLLKWANELPDDYT